MSLHGITLPTRQSRSTRGVGVEADSYSYSLCETIDQRDPEEWRPFHQGQADPMMDPRFLRSVERSMRGARFWNVVVHDGGGRPAAAAVLSLYTVDGAMMLEGRWRQALESARRVVPGLLKFPALFCGCPVSTGQNHLRIAPWADEAQVLGQLNRLLHTLARKHRARWISFKEFAEPDVARIDGLVPLGYIRGSSPQMNCLPTRFRDLDHLCASLRSHYRRKIVLSKKKFEQSGLQIEHTRDGARIGQMYTDDVHKLYLSVLDRAEVKLECLPAEFFRELARQFPDDTAFTFITRGDEVVAFSCGLFHNDTYQNLFVGYDAELNAEADLYFNVMLSNLDFALRQNVRSIHVGQTANEFKSRVGCYTEPRFFYVKARNPLSHFLLRKFSPLLFPAPAEAPERNVFK
jgi:predicted N-acyltransferase